MIDISKIDYSALDIPQVLNVLFHPRPEFMGHEEMEPTQDLLIPTDDNVYIGARFHLKEDSAPSILFFHGNGEIVADYDDMGRIYNEMGLNFIPVDYRGYGRSNGSPTVTSMMRDAHVIFEWVQNWMTKNGHKGPFMVMGRSLGSASALELAAHYPDRMDGLIIESGFSHVIPLLELLGLHIEALGIREKEGSRNIDKIKSFHKPTLIIHAEYDHIIPFTQGQDLYDASPADDKRMLKIPRADHNTLFHYGMTEYLNAIKAFVDIILS
ncbi:MAG: alpha/beta hydrolase [Deltaproteobacteria bacterium]|nr:alpha/beta hydrolase [Deltaproteobacteria bacterium]